MTTRILLVALGLVLPAAASAQMIKVEKSATSPLGYYVYLPSGYHTTNEPFPVLLFLHGDGDQGNGTTDLTKVLRNGPPKLINNGTWPADLPLVVVAPQLPGNQSGWYTPTILKIFEIIEDNIRLDPDRLYITGLSLGGNGTYNAVKALYDAHGENKVAAIAPIAAWGGSQKCEHSVPLWAFHGEIDGTIELPRGLTPVNWYNKHCNPQPPAHITIYPGVGHNSWDRAYNPAGSGDSNIGGDCNGGDDCPEYTSMYHWLLSFRRNGAPAPTNTAPQITPLADVTLDEGDTVELDVFATDAEGDSIAIDLAASSPAFASITDFGDGTASLTLQPANGDAGTHVVTIEAQDALGATRSTSFTVTVNAESDPTPGPWGKISFANATAYNEMPFGVHPVENLFDEQELAGDPLNGQGGDCTTSWSAKFGGAELWAYVDLGAEYTLDHICLYDRNGSGTYSVSVGAPGDWTETITDTMSSYKSWKCFPRDHTTRYLRFYNSTGYVAVPEVVLYGALADDTPPEPEEGTVAKLDLSEAIGVNEMSFDTQPVTRLFDEQDIAGDPVNGQGGDPVTTWTSIWGNPDIYAYIDLGQVRTIRTICLYDRNGTGDYRVFVGAPGDWTETIQDGMGSYKSWKCFERDHATRYVRFYSSTGYVGMPEVVLYGF